MKTRILEDVLKTHPNFKPQWEELPYGGLENPKFGRLSHIVVCKDDGTPIYDQYMIEEQPGSIVVPYDNNNEVIRVGLVKQERPIPEREYTELPRGFGREDENALETAYRELLEETGLKASKDGVKVLGRINFNTTFYKTDVPVISIAFDNLDDMGNPEGDKFAERFIKVAPHNFDQVKDLMAKEEIECGITQAALFRFASYKPEFILGKKAVKYQQE